MIIGDGDIAKALKEVDRDDLLFFASGVSNSQELDEAEYEKERQLLYKYVSDTGEDEKHIVYFSSLAVFYGDSRYVRHKRMMEAVVKSLFEHYTIVRLGNITWGTNPHTLVNYLRNKIEKGEEYKVEDVYRYLINKQEFLHWMEMIPSWNCEMNCPGLRLKVADIVSGIKAGSFW